jgi:hypothetical protein
MMKVIVLMFIVRTVSSALLALTSMFRPAAKFWMAAVNI